MSSGGTISSLITGIITNTTVDLVWSGTYNTVSIQQSEDNITYNTVITNITDTSYTVTGLTTNTLYYFIVTAYDISGSEGTSKSTFTTTDYNVEITSFYSGTPTTTTIPLFWNGSYYKVDLYYRLHGQLGDMMYYETIIGKPSYTITSLLEDTSYDFQIIPYNIGDEPGTESNIITTSTDYVPYITSFSLARTYSTTATLQWTGKFSYITIQKSINNVNFATDSRMISGTSSISTDGSFAITGLSPYYEYYFRIIPYSYFYNPGEVTNSVYGKTLMGISEFLNETPTTNSVLLKWSGIYTRLKIYKLINNNIITVADILNSSTNTTIGSYKVNSLSQNTNYSFYLQPYNGYDRTTISDILNITTDFSAQVNIVINNDDLSYASIPLIFDTSGVISPYYEKALIQISNDSGRTYTDVSLITHKTTVTNKYVYTISNLNADTSYNIHVLPYSFYGVSGDHVYKIVATKGYIKYASARLNDANNIVIDCSGVYTKTIIRYVNNNNIVNEIQNVSVYPYTITNISSSVPYYFSIYPVNKLNILGTPTTQFYNPVITQFYLSSITSTRATASWTGNYDKLTIQYSSYDASGVFVDISSCSSSNITFDVSSSYTTQYYRVIPYTSTDISGRISSLIYLPVVTSISIKSILPGSIIITWKGIYNTLKIQYSTTSPSTGFVDLHTFITSQSNLYATNEFNISDAILSPLNTGSVVYYFRAIPFSIGYGTTVQTTGVSSYSVYNPIIKTFTAETYSSSPSNAIKLNFTGTFKYAELFYRKNGSNYTSEYIEINGGDTSSIVYGLTSNTKYYFYIIPYNDQYIAGVASQEISMTTRSMIDYLNFTYSSSNSTASSIYFYWTNTLYSYIDIYNSNNVFITRVYNTDNNYYDSTTFETLLPDETYLYTLKVYDDYGSNETTTITTYTAASFTTLGINPSRYETGITFTWTNTGYTTISIQNSSTGSVVKTYTDNPNVSTYYDSYNDEYYYDEKNNSSSSHKNLLPNTNYNYIFTLTNKQGLPVSRTITITTLAQLDFRIVNSGTNLITASSIPIKIGGIFSGATIYVDDGSNTYGNSITVSNVIPVNTLPLNMIYYYPFNEDFYNYSTGYSRGDALDYNSFTFSRSDKMVGLSSLYFNSSKNQYLELTPVANNGDGLTIAFWFKSVNSGNSAKIFDFMGNDMITRLYFSAGGSANSAISYTNNSGIQTMMDLGVSYNDNVWRHIAIVFWKDLLKWEVYINGVKNGTLTGANFPVLTKNYKNYIGKSNNLIENYYNGYIDDFRVYNTSLTSTAIYRLIMMGGYDVSLNAANGITLISSSNTQYYIKVVGINGSGNTSTATDVQSAKTLGKMTSSSIISYDSSSVYMAWDGSYSYVVLENATNTDFTTNYESTPYTTKTTIYNKNNLKPNTKYYFRVTPINQPISSDVSGESYIIGNTVTLSTITSLYVTGNLSNSITLAWDGSFSKVAIKQSNDNGNTYSFIPGYYSGKTANISDLSSNYTYYYNIVSLNSVDISSNSSIVTYGTTLGSLSTVYASDISSTSVYIALSGSSVSSYYADISGGGSNGYDTSSNLTTSSPLLVTGLLPNTVYDFRVNAFNNIYGIGTAVQKDLLGVKTLASIGSVDLSAISHDTIRVELKNSYYSSFYVYNGASFSTLYTSSPVYISGLTGNTVYDITVYAYKTTNGSGAYVSKTSSTTTLAYIENIYASNITESGFSIGLSSDSKFASYKVKYTEKSSGLNTTTSLSTSSPINITNLTSNNVYTITVYAYNTNIGTGTAITQTMGNTVTTLGSIKQFYTTTPIDSSSIAIYWDGSFSSVNFEYARTSDFSTGLVSTIVNSSTGGKYVVYNLLPNTKYYYRVTPIIKQSYYGNTDAYGTTVTNDVSGTTLSTISTFSVSSTVSDLTMDTIKLLWDGSFSYITIQQSTDNFVTDITTLSTQYNGKYAYITGLLSNKTYYYRASSSNSAGATNSVKTAVTSATTLSSIKQFYTTTPIDSSSISLYWDGSYASVGLERATTADFGTNFRSIRISGSSGGVYKDINLDTNTKYYYRVTPINKPYGSGTNDVSGTTVTNDVSGTTLANMTSFSITSADVSTNSVPLVWDGSFSNINIYTSTDGTNYTIYSSSPFSGKSTTVTGLAPNQLYYFKARPINSIGTYSNYYSTIPSTTTLAYIKDFSAITINAYNVTLKLSDSSYSSFKIGYNVTGNTTIKYTSIIVSPTQTTTVTDLSANTSYYFKAFAYNNTAGTGTYVTADVSDIVTLPTITGAVINNSTIDLSSTFIKPTIYGDYTSFKVTYIKNNVTYTQGYYNNTNTFTISDLSANTTYYYTVYVNNRTNGTGTDVSAVFSATTLGSTPLFNLVASNPARTNSMSFNIYSGDYSKIYIQTATDTNMSNIIFTKTISNEDISTIYNNIYTQTGLSENTDYYFNCTPINSLNQYGTPSTTLHATTLGNIYSVSLNTSNSISTSSIPIQWSGTYNNLTVEYAPYVSDSIGSYSTFNTITGNSSSTVINSDIYVTGLTSNMKYAFRLTPINNMSYNGTAYVLTDVSLVTLAKVLSMTKTGHYDTSASFLIDGSMSSLIVYSSPSTLYKQYTYSTGGISTGTDISGLTPNAAYVFYFAAVNSIGVSNPIGLLSNPIDASYSIITRPKIYSVSYIDGSATLIDLSLSGAFTSYEISYSYDIGTTYTTFGIGLTTLTPIVTGLDINTGYKFKITPYSSTSGLYGSSYISSTMYTDPSINYVRILSTTDSTITLSFVSYFNISSVPSPESLTIFYTFDTGTYLNKINSYYDIYNSKTLTYDASINNITPGQFSTKFFKYGISSLNISINRNCIDYNNAFTPDSNGLTFSFWYYVPLSASISTNDRHYIFDFGNGPNVDNIFFAIYFQNTTNPLILDGTLFVNNYMTRNSYIPFSTEKTLSKGVWHHFALVLTTTNITLYYDSIQTMQSSSSYYYPNNITLTRNKIGYTNWGQNGTGNNGYIDNFMVYNKALSQSEITSLYNL